VQIVDDSIEEITFRITGLALGMKPALKILGEDGETVIQELSLELSENEDSYLFVSVPVGLEKLFFAEVSHYDSGTGLYHISAGETLASDTQAAPGCATPAFVFSMQTSFVFAMLIFILPVLMILIRRSEQK